jgi:hypothetical protein
MEAKGMGMDRHDVVEAGFNTGQYVLHFCEIFER